MPAAEHDAATSNATENDVAALGDVASELYARDPAQFVAARKAAAAAAKDSGNRALAAAIGKLRKPTTVGWMVNLLVSEEPDDIADLFDLGDRLRDAQRRSAVRDLRELSADRQKLVRVLSTRAVELAAAHGRPSSEDAAREVGQTLTAALADPDVADRVRAGRVVTAESYSGFGPASLTLAPEAEDSAESSIESHDSSPSPQPPDHGTARADAQNDLDEAYQDEEAARAAADEAATAAHAAASALTEIKDRLARLRAELHEAEEQEADARRAEKSTDRESRRLRRVLRDAEATTEERRRALDSLR